MGRIITFAPLPGSKRDESKAFQGPSNANSQSDGGALFQSGFTFGLTQSASSAANSVRAANNTASFFTLDTSQLQHASEPSNKQTKQRSIAWYPATPYELSIPSIENGAEFKENTLLAAKGSIRMNDYEIKAIMEVLEARSEFQDWAMENKMAKDAEVIDKLHMLSQKYRLALTCCIAGWESQEEQPLTEQPVDVNSLTSSIELLKSMLAVMHLSEIYLLPKAIPTGASLSLTASTVRYLRLNHLDQKYSITEDFAEVNNSIDEGEDPVRQMLESDCPESWGREYEDPSSNVPSLYWRQVRILVARGCLKEAWKLLSCHSLCVNDGPLADQQGFLHLRAILLSAPLPGGRDDELDDGFVARHDQEKKFRREQQSLLETDEQDEIEDEREPVLEGIPSNAYRGWDLTPELNKGVAMHTALANWNTWSHHVRRVARDGSLSGGLIQRIPALRWAVLDVLAGQAPRDSFSSGAEALCTELLYQNPSIRISDIPIRFEVASKVYGEESDLLQHVILPIMNNGSEQAIAAIHTLEGGTGAALPTTITALIFDLLVLSKCIPIQVCVGEAKVNFRTEYTLAAAWACEASFNNIKQSEVGVQYASSLLLIEGSSRAREACYDMICRQKPSSDAQAKLLIQVCEKHSFLADAGASVALYRARHYISDSRPGGVAFWMLRGIECELKDSSTNGSSKIAAMSFYVYCIELASKVLGVLVPTFELGQPFPIPLLKKATEVVSTACHDVALGMLDGMASSSFALLSNVTDLAQALESKDFPAAGSKIVSCLAERVDSDGVSTPLAHQSLWLNILKVAFILLEMEENEPTFYQETKHEKEFQPTERCIHAFNVEGVHALLASFNLLESRDDAESLFNAANIVSSQSHELIDEDYAPNSRSISEIRLLLAKSLMRAIVRQNSSRKPKADEERQHREKKETERHAPSLLGYLEEPTELLLGPPPCVL